MRKFSLAEVQSHTTEKDCWIIIDGKVYDVTNFLTSHPGGKKIILGVAGKDATKKFHQYHDVIKVLNQYNNLLIGTVESQNEFPGSVGNGDKFGSDIPFAEPAWYRGFKSPYYKQTHKDFRAKIRQFVEKEFWPHGAKWEEEGDYPREIHEIAYKAGIYAANFPTEYGGTPPSDYDPFHYLIFWDELGRIGYGGIIAAVFVSVSIALPPILSVGSKELKDRVVPDIINGKKIIALAITEPFAGSDVSNVQTTATRAGDFYIVNGQKKFITSGCKADYYTVAVRTGAEGMWGVSLLLIERNSPGITVRRMKTQGWWSSNTAHLLFEDVKVPVKNLIGQENAGFIPIMLNFNYERLEAIIGACRACRLAIEESIKFARERKTFGKRLIDHQVIRHKIADMAMRVESLQAALEDITYQIASKVPPDMIAGAISLMKVVGTKTTELCAREASQIFGGNSYLRTGVGSGIERLYREVRVMAIGGGSEEVMLDLAMRQAKL